MRMQIRSPLFYSGQSSPNSDTTENLTSPEKTSNGPFDQLHAFNYMGKPMTKITPLTLMALLGGLTGIISALLPGAPAEIPNALKIIAQLFLLDPVRAPIHPGLLFGLVVGAGAWWVGERRVWALGLTFLITVFAWSAAVNTAHSVYEIKGEGVIFGVTVRSSNPAFEPIIILLSGFVAGVVGAAMTVIGCALVLPSLRSVGAVSVTAIVGGIAGLLLYPVLDKWNETPSIIALFAVWQASVGACIGWWMTGRPANVPA